MPGRDGTGPLGTGPLGSRSEFGRRMGYCHLVNPGLIGCGLGLGFGLGMGFRGGRSNAVSIPENPGLTQKEVLEEHKRLLETRLNLVNEQLEKYKDQD